MNKKKKLPLHPGEILLVQFLEKRGITQYRLAKSIGVSYARINKLVLGQRTISADTAWRLGKFFIKPAEYWLKLQMTYDLEVARKDLETKKKLKIPTYKEVKK